MAKNKTIETEVSVVDFINSYVASDQNKVDSFRLIDFMREWSGFEPKMWGATIIGFSPRKIEFSLYVFSPTPDNKHLLDDLGKFKIGKACIYVKRLSDINILCLEKLCKTTIAYLNEHDQCACK